MTILPTSGNSTRPRVQSARVREVPTGGEAEAGVPTSPEWTPADLAGHLASVQWWWSAVVGTHPAD